MITETIHDLYHGAGTARQGDVMLIPVDSVPNDAVPVKQGDEHVIAHSETGHNHTMSALRVNFFMMPSDPLEGYLTVDEATVLDHQRTFHTHESIRVHPGTYKIRRQREYSPEGWQRAAD